MKGLFHLILPLLLLGTSAQAMDMGLGVGYRLNDGSSTQPSASVDGVGSLQLGGLLYAPLGSRFELRSGFMYTQRHFEVGGTDVKLAYVDVPATALIKLADYGGAFLGVNAAMKVSDDCGGVDCNDAKSFLVPVTFGGYFKVAPQVAVEVFYELVTGELYSGLKDATTVGANLMFTLD